MVDVIENRFHPRGTWLWAMGQVELGYTVIRKVTGIRVRQGINWAIGRDDALAEDWEIDAPVFEIGDRVQRSPRWLLQNARREHWKADRLGTVVGRQASYEAEEWPLVQWGGKREPEACYPAHLTLAISPQDE